MKKVIHKFSALSKKSCLAISLAAAFLMAGTGAMAAQAGKNYVDQGNVGLSWKFDKFLGSYPNGGLLTDLTFRFTVNEETLHALGTYFAQQFYFVNPGYEGNVAYTGLQPQPDRNGKQYLRALFSSFIAQSTTTDKNCHNGADYGPGVSCAVVFPATYGHTYKILVHKTSDHTWSGDVEDEQSDQKVHIGSWKLVDHIGDMIPTGVGFAEYFAYYMPGYPQGIAPGCDKLAKISVVYGPVSTTNYGGGIGQVYSPYEYNSKECKSKSSNYSEKSISEILKFPGGKELVDNGLEIERGWVSKN